MALTTYSYVSGTTAKALTDAVFAAGVSPVGLPIQRGTVLIQFTGEGIQDVGTVEDYKVISGATPDELVTNVKAVLSDTVQPVGEPVQRGNALFQVMGNITVESGSGSSYTLPAATGSTLGGVSIGGNIGVNSNGEISVAQGSASTLGLVKGGHNIAFGDDGSISTSTANTTTAGAVKQLANVPALASDADAAAIVTALNAFLTDAKAKGNMVADS